MSLCANKHISAFNIKRGERFMQLKWFSSIFKMYYVFYLEMKTENTLSSLSVKG